jgi:hypothetical protein
MRAPARERNQLITFMHHRIGSTVVAIAALDPFAAHAQVAPSARWLGPAQPQGQPTYARPAYPQSSAQPHYPQNYAQPAYPQPYASRPYPQAYYRSGSATSDYASPTQPTPASYAYAGNAGYGGYPAGSYPLYPQGNQPRAGSWGAPRAEAPQAPVPTKDTLHYVEMGMGAFLPTDAGNPAKVGLEANVWAIHGGWVPNSGLFLTLDASTGFDIGCMAARATDGCKGHLRIHWIGTGPFFNTGTPMIARDVPRSWDLMALTGAEVRLWRGLTTKATINWFVPSPWGVYDHQKQMAETNLSGSAAAGVPSTASGQVEPPNPVDGVESVLGHALKHPQFNLMAMWEF